MTVPGERNAEKLAILEALKSMPVTLENEVAGLSDNILRYRAAEGESSIKELLGQLRDLSAAWYTRLYTITTLTDPRWRSVDFAAGMQEKRYQDADARQLIAAIQEERAKIADLLAHSVDWTRLGQDPDMGRRSLKQWGAYLVELDRGYIAKIRALKEAQTTARLP